MFLTPKQILMLLYITANGSQFSSWWPIYKYRYQFGLCGHFVGHTCATNESESSFPLQILALYRFVDAKPLVVVCRYPLLRILSREPINSCVLYFSSFDDAHKIFYGNVDYEFVIEFSANNV